MDKMDGAFAYHSINCVQLCLDSMLMGIKSHAKEWLTIFGNLLQEMAKSRLLTALNYIKVGPPTYYPCSIINSDTVDMGANIC